MNFPWHQYLLALVFVAAGVSHFKWPKVYRAIMPSYFPAHDTLIILSGMLEMVVGFMLISGGTSSIGAWGMLVLLVLFIPIHVHMLLEEKASLKLPKWVLILRIPLQFGLMYWAWQYV